MIPFIEEGEAATGLTRWLYLLAALALGVIGAFALWQRRGGPRSRLQFAGVPENFFDEPPPPAAPAAAFRPAPPLQRNPAEGNVTSRRLAVPSESPPPKAPPEPKPASSSGGGIVSTRLRPWLDLDIAPARLVLTKDGARLGLECLLQNSGSVPARDVRIEAALINARDEQDAEIATFFGRDLEPAANGPDVGPMSRSAVRSTVAMKREAMQPYAAAGRTLFVPLLLFTVRYRWSGGEGHSAACFLLGRSGGEEGKLAPLRLDRGDQDYRDLDYRRLTAAVRR